MTGTLFRRCGCRGAEDPITRKRPQYGVLPENATEAHKARACPLMLEDAKHGWWSFRISAGFDPITGKRRQVNGRSYATKREAQQERNKAAVKVDRGTYLVASRERLADYLPTWLQRRATTDDGLKPTTRENYDRYIRNDIAPSTLGTMKLGDIRRHHVNAFIEQLSQDGRGAVTVRRIIAVLQGAMSDAERDGLIEDSPARGVRLPKVERKRVTVWEPEQVGTFLDVAAEHRLGALFEVAMFTGMRRAELVGLRWADVDLESRRATIRNTRVQTGGGTLDQDTTKTDAGVRIVDLDDAAVGALIAWSIAQDAERAQWGTDWHDTGYVFTNELGQPLKPQYVTRLFDKLRVKAGLPKLTLHGTRHEHAALMISSGADIALVSKRLGHASVSITSDIYGHLIGSASRDAANRAASLVPRKRGGAHTLHTQPPENAEEAVPAFDRNRL